MKRRTRFVAGVLTLVALTFSIAGGVGASVCAAEIGMAGHGSVAGPGTMVGDHEMANHHHMDHMDHMAGHDDGPGSPQHDCSSHGSSGEQAPSCPFGSLAMGSSCTAAASLPAPTSGFASSAEEAVRLAVLSDKPHVLLGSALFHPPRP